MSQQDTEKFAKKLLGESEIEIVLHRLDRLTQEEGRITVAQTLEVVHGLMNAVKVVMNGTQRLSQLCTAVRLKCCLGRRQSIDGWYLEGFRYAFTKLGLVAVDEVARCDATNGERDKQNETFVINLYCDHGLVALS
jgi:hypothetical protein